MPRGARGAASRARHSAARAKIYNDKIKSPQHKKSSDIIREGQAFLTKTFDKEPKVPDKIMSESQSRDLPKYCDVDLHRVGAREDGQHIQHFIYAGNSRMTEQDAIVKPPRHAEEHTDGGVRHLKDNVKSVVSLRWADMVDDDESLSDDDIAPDVDRALADLYLY